jgi:hypothetical protein
VKRAFQARCDVRFPESCETNQSSAGKWDSDRDTFCKRRRRKRKNKKKQFQISIKNSKSITRRLVSYSACDWSAASSSPSALGNAELALERELGGGAATTAAEEVCGAGDAASFHVKRGSCTKASSTAMRESRLARRTSITSSQTTRKVPSTPATSKQLINIRVQRKGTVSGNFLRSILVSKPVGETEEDFFFFFFFPRKFFLFSYSHQNKYE